MARTKLSMRGISFIIIGIVVLIIVIFTGKFFLTKVNGKSPVDLTLEYMNKYKNASNEVMDNIVYPYDDELSEVQLNTYKELIKSQYLGLNYEIVDENVGEIDAIIKVEFEVLDYRSSYDKATSYLSLYEKDMKEDKKIDYKLDEMKKTKEKVKYSIEFKYYKLDNKWQMTDVSKADLAKLTGTF